MTARKMSRGANLIYAKCRGSWWSPKDSSLGCSFWFLRTSGYTQANAVYVGAGGEIYNRGMVNTCNDAAVLPALILDLSRPRSPSPRPSGPMISFPSLRPTFRDGLFSYLPKKYL